MKWLALVCLVVGCDVEATLTRGLTPKSGAGGSCVFSGDITFRAIACSDNGYCLLCMDGKENGPHLTCQWINAYTDCR